jgi:AbrB family looped-hinge helix DNA binding protein
MKTLVTTVTERGQVSIPAQIRKQLKLNSGEHLVWEAVSDHECRILVAPKQHTVGAVAMLGYARRFRPPRRTSAWIAELREGDG